MMSANMPGLGWEAVRAAATHSQPSRAGHCWLGRHQICFPLSGIAPGRDKRDRGRCGRGHCKASTRRACLRQHDRTHALHVVLPVTTANSFMGHSPGRACFASSVAVSPSLHSHAPPPSLACPSSSRFRAGQEPGERGKRATTQARGGGGREQQCETLGWEDRER